MNAQQNELPGLPIPPVVDENYFLSLPVEFITGLLEPYTLGYKKGEDWVKTVNIKNIHEAVFRLTSNEQIEEQFARYYKEVVETGMSCGDIDWGMDVTPPTEWNGDFGLAIANFFQDMEELYYFLKGYADADDKDICRYDYVFSEVPNYHFRKFEDGWTQAVRDFHKSLLLEYHYNERLGDCPSVSELI